MSARSSESSAARDSEDLRFSVIVPVYRHWELVPKLLGGMREQTFPADRFEVILVDNDPAVPAPPLDLDANMRIVKCETPGSYAARNRGAADARGRWLVFTDADCLPRPDWLEALDRAISRDADHALLAGPVDVVGSSSSPSPAEIYDIVKGIPQERYLGRGYAATANLAVSRPLFDLVGGFDGGRLSGGDADFCRRAGAKGYRIALVDDARVDHPARTDWREVVTKERRVKGGQLRAGPAGRRRLWLVRTLLPPVDIAASFLGRRRHPLRYRLVACGVLTAIWIVGIVEAVRLLAGGTPERR